MKVTICLISLFIIVAQTQTPPVFPPQYELAFNEKATIGPTSGTTTGKIYLDATNNRQFISR
jgi:hypothetical protein